MNFGCRKEECTNLEENVNLGTDKSILDVLRPVETANGHKMVNETKCIPTTGKDYDSQHIPPP